MNKNYIFISVIVIVAVGIGVFFLLSNKSGISTNIDSGIETTVQENITPQNGAINEDNEGDTTTNTTSRYVDYTKDSFENTSDKRRVLFFYASWCPTCKAADPNIRQNVSRIPEDTVVIRVNYNDPDTDQQEKELAKQYGITYQHTFVQIDSSGNEVSKWNGGQIEELLSNLK